MCGQVYVPKKEIIYPKLGKASFKDWAISRELGGIGGGRYFAGNSSKEMVNRVGKLLNRGFPVIIDLLGEEVNTHEVAYARHTTTLEVGALIADLELQGSAAMAIRPGQFGYDYGLMETTVHLLVKRYGIFVWVDMEHDKDVDPTISSFVRLMDKFGDRVGMAYQGYLERTAGDRNKLIDKSARTGIPLNLRVTRGVYLPESDVIRALGIDVTKPLNPEQKRILYLELHKRLAQEIVLVGSCGVSTVNLQVATHEPVQLATAAQLYTGGKSRITGIQVLLGVYSTEIYGEMRDFSKMPWTIYVPFGPNTYKYIKRRLEEAGGAVVGLLNARIDARPNQELFEYLASHGIQTEPFDPMHPFKDFKAGDPNNHDRMQAILDGRTTTRVIFPGR